jgi:hypothetical protein
MKTSNVIELFEINAFIENTIAVANETAKSDPDSWKMAYDLVFSKDCSQRAYTLLKDLNISFDYYDPDTSYEEDIEAFARALKNTCEEIAVFYPSVAKVYFPQLTISGNRSHM